LTDCLFCDIAEGYTPEDRPENVILYESEHFFVKPALGQFIEGYCLIVSKHHVRTMAELHTYARHELREVLDEMGRRLQSMYTGGRCVFEHGSVCPQNRAGACIDHAHVHLLPVNCDVRPELTSIFHCRLSDHMTDWSGLHSIADSYVYYEPEPNVRELYLCGERLPSQVMRKLICARMGIPDRWDWRVAPCEDAIVRFLRRWRRAFQVVSPEIGAAPISLKAP
jgi:diadenosine tetraphosphate (Ap4A) HIT family hydrolase